MKNRVIRFLLSLILTAILMAVLVSSTSQDSPERIPEMLGGVFPQGLIQGFTYFLFLFGLSEVLLEAAKLSRERKTLPSRLLPELGEGLSCQDALALTEDRLKVLQTRMSGRTAYIRYVCWAIPSVGFIGTVIGISAALGHAGQAATAEGIDYITRMLCVAFDTTLVALVLVIILNFFQHFIEKRQDEFIADAGVYLNESITEHFRQASQGMVTESEDSERQETTVSDESVRRRRYRVAAIALSVVAVCLCILLFGMAGKRFRSTPQSGGDEHIIDTVGVCAVAETPEDTLADQGSVVQTPVTNIVSEASVSVNTDAAAEAAEPTAEDVSAVSMEISDVLFANVGAKGKIVSGYGAPLTASEVRYLKPKVLYRSTGSEMNVQGLRCRLIGPDGKTIRGKDSPEDFTSAGKYMIYPGENRELLLPGWGCRYPGFYSPGSYRYEIWSGEDLLHLSELVMR